MARREEVWIAEDGRDRGKHFKLREMSALYGERWAIRAFSCLVKAGMTIPENVQHGGWGALQTLVRDKGGEAFFSALFSAPVDEVQELMDELLVCVTRIPDAKSPWDRPLVNQGDDGDDIEEVSTRLKLRMAVLNLHTGFLSAGEGSRSSLEISPALNS